MKKVFFILKGSFIACFIAFMLCFPESCADAATQALSLFVNSVLIVCFPFFVIGGMLPYSGLDGVFADVFSPIARFFRIPSVGLGAYFISLVCGYPSGVRSACHYSTLSDSPSSLRLYVLCSNPGLVFTVSTLGGAFFSDRTAGIIVYISCVFASALTTKIVFDKTNLTCYFPKKLYSSADQISFYSSLTKSLPSAVASAANVGGYIVFFAVLSACIREIIPPGTLCEIIVCLMEMTYAVKYLSSFYSLNPPFVLAMSAFLASFGGVCVIFQSAEYIKNTSFARYVALRAVSGVVAFVAAYLIKSLI